ncbi:hypothetical protein ROS72_004650 [Citrobacter freundii]|nr:hypothetical protein [Citrobacter freundii]
MMNLKTGAALLLMVAAAPAFAELKGCTPATGTGGVNRGELRAIAGLQKGHDGLRRHYYAAF